MIAAPCSGSGKTLLSLCLTALARERGQLLQPFKVGPDYLDPQLLGAVANQPCRNLDTLLCGPDWVERCFHWHGSRAQQVLVEGVMGLFDGRGPSAEGSSAEVAALLHLPVVLVVEASRQAGSLAALVRGFRDHGPPQVRLAGVVLNRVGSERHRALLSEALESIQVPLLGVLPQHPALELPSRHLGLLPPGELADLGARRRIWARLAAEHLDLERLLPLLAPPGPPPAGSPDPVVWALNRTGRGGAPEPHAAGPDPVAAAVGVLPERAPGASGGSTAASPTAVPPTAATPALAPSAVSPSVSASSVPSAAAAPAWAAADGATATHPVLGSGGRAGSGWRDGSDRPSAPIVAIASDRAFHFRYPEAEELLRAVGLEPRAWSPLADEPLPPHCRAVLLPGGYPELHAEQLAASRRSLAALAEAAAAGVPIVAECGGLLLLGQQLCDSADQPHAMAGVLPFSARRGDLSLGYRQAEVVRDGLLVRRGEVLTGHEFHRWQLQPWPADSSPGAALGDDPPRRGRLQSSSPMTGTEQLWQLEGWGSARRLEGWTTTRVHATWLHLHWAGCPAIPWRLAAASASAAPLPKSAASSIPPIAVRRPSPSAGA